MILVAEKQLAMLLAPPGIHVLPPTFALRSIRNLAPLDLGILLPAVPPLGDTDDARIHDLTLHRRETVGAKMRIKGRKQFFHYAGLDEVFPKKRDRHFGVPMLKVFLVLIWTLTFRIPGHGGAGIDGDGVIVNKSIKEINYLRAAYYCRRLIHSSAPSFVLSQ